MKKSLSALLSFAVVVLSPGLAPYAAAANLGGRGLSPVTGVSLPGTIKTGPAIPALPAAIPALNALPQVSGAPLPIAAPAAQGVPAATAQQSLVNTVQNVVAAQQSGAASNVSASLTGAFDGAGKLQAGSVSDVPGGTGASAPLAPLTVEQLTAVAKDAKAPAADRQAAVRAIADKSEDAAKLALEEIGTATGGDAADYEIKRAALRSLYAKHGKLVSLPAISEAHKAKLLERLVNDKPAAAAFDYDGTLEKHAEPASRETAAALRYAAEAGVKVMMLTDRSDVKNPEKANDVTILDSLSTLTPKERSTISVGANRGARVLSFDAQGNAQLQREEPGWTDAQKESLAAARAEAATRYGAHEFNGRTGEISTYGMAHFLPVGTPEAKLKEAAAWLQADLAKRGIDVEVVGRAAYKPTDPPYLTLSKIDKSLGIKLFRGDLPAEKLLVVGDHFMEPRAVDVDMVKGAPGALAIAVGGVADPRLDNIFVWPTKGKDASQEILNALARRSPDLMNKKAVFGLFLQRTISISAFIGTALAYPFIVSQYIGSHGYGNLLAMGQIVAIAAGPLTGIIVDRFSARKGMAINAILRGLFALEIPVTVGLGFINFWTLLFGAIANGWLLSSIMTTEGAYIRRLAGAKNVLTLNSVAMINYFVLQVVLNVIIGVGSFVTPATLVLPFAISAAAHLLLVLPVIWFTIPNLAPVPKRLDRMVAVRKELAGRLDGMSPEDRADALESLRELDAAIASRKGADEARKPFLTNAREFFSKYRVPALITAAASISYIWLASPLPIALSLVYWISRTPTFSALWGDKKLRTASLMLLAGAFVFYPIQSFALQGIAASLAGAGKALLYGRLLGALFLGQMLGNALLAQLPKVTLPLVKKVVEGKTLMRIGALALLGVSIGTALVPGNWVMAAAAVAGMSLIMKLTAKLEPVSWVRFSGLGLAALLLPLLAWGNLPLLFAGVLLFGYAYGPSMTTLTSYFQQNARKGNAGAVLGVHGSLFNTAISLGYAGLSLLASLFTPAFPTTLLFIAIAALALGAAYWIAPKLLPDLGKK